MPKHKKTGVIFRHGKGLKHVLNCTCRCHKDGGVCTNKCEDKEKQND